MKKSRIVDTVNENSCTFNTIVSAMKNTCKKVSYWNNSHIILELNSEIEEHTNHDLILWTKAYTNHDLILEDQHNKISYIIKILNYTQKMMKDFLDDLKSSIIKLNIIKSSNMKSSIKISNSVNLRQCKKISRDLNELNLDKIIISIKLNQDQIIQITNKIKYYLKIQSLIN
jgi:hypothetical protein